MRESYARFDGALSTIREVRTIEDPAVQRVIESASALSAMVSRLMHERAAS
jgi:hypothetical protein